jgi:hypothetical protein
MLGLTQPQLGRVDRRQRSAGFLAVCPFRNSWATGNRWSRQWLPLVRRSPWYAGSS